MTARSSLYSSSMMPPPPPSTLSSFGWSDFPIPSEYHCGESFPDDDAGGHDHQDDDCPYLDEKDFQDTSSSSSSSSSSLASHLLLSCSPDSVTMIDYDLSWQRQQEWMRNKAREEQQQQQSCRCPPTHIAATRVSFDTNVHIRTFPVLIVTGTNSVELGWEYQDDEIEVTMVDDDRRRRRRPLRKWTFEERREILNQQQRVE